MQMMGKFATIMKRDIIVVHKMKILEKLTYLEEQIFEKAKVFLQKCQTKAELYGQLITWPNVFPKLPKQDPRFWAMLERIPHENMIDVLVLFEQNAGPVMHLINKFEELQRFNTLEIGLELLKKKVNIGKPRLTRIKAWKTILMPCRKEERSAVIELLQGVPEEHKN